MNATPELRLYAILLSERNIAWLSSWLKAGVTSEPEQPEIIEVLDAAISRIANMKKEKP